ncbi:type II toxin-antitoxin system MqsA family antitoxin [Candidatus Poribacteria bacterium]|nr:type II toxin-antitoxin system MqsA family antitoxin [Candidatus Poribacteria bacterium]
MKKCYFCRGEIQEQSVDVIRKRKGQVFIMEDVPALVCQRCGERYYTAEVARTMDEKIAEGINKTKRVISVPILSFDVDYAAS